MRLIASQCAKNKTFTLSDFMVPIEPETLHGPAEPMPQEQMKSEFRAFMNACKSLKK